MTLTPALLGSGGPGPAGGALSHGLSGQVVAVDALVFYAATHRVGILRVLRFTIKATAINNMFFLAKLNTPSINQSSMDR